MPRLTTGVTGKMLQLLAAVYPAHHQKLNDYKPLNYSKNVRPTIFFLLPYLSFSQSCGGQLYLKHLQYFMYKFLLFSLLLALALSQSSCGGNCANKWCKTCDCGQTPNYPDLDVLCRTYDYWNQNCCKCIILRLSKGNTNQMNGAGYDAVVSWSGLADLSRQQCDVSIKERCNPNTTLKCMHEIYAKTTDWSHWKDAASACGCFSNLSLKGE